MSFLLDGSQRSIRRRLENKISKEVMSGNSISTSGTGERVISHLVTLLATSRTVTLTGVDVDAKAVAHDGDKLSWSEMEWMIELLGWISRFRC